MNRYGHDLIVTGPGFPMAAGDLLLIKHSNGTLQRIRVDKGPPDVTKGGVSVVHTEVMKEPAKRHPTP